MGVRLNDDETNECEFCTTMMMMIYFLVEMMMLMRQTFSKLEREARCARM